LLRAFKHLKVIDPMPASSFYLIFFKKPDGSIRVKVDYSDDPKDFSKIESVVFTSQQTKEDASIPIRDF
jgi:hypothetical protein